MREITSAGLNPNDPASRQIQEVFARIENATKGIRNAINRGEIQNPQSSWIAKNLQSLEQAVYDMRGIMMS